MHFQTRYGYTLTLSCEVFFNLTDQDLKDIEDEYVIKVAYLNEDDEFLEIENTKSEQLLD